MSNMHTRNPANKLLIRRNSTLSRLVIPAGDISAPIEPTVNIIHSGLLYEKQQAQEESHDLFFNFLFDQFQKEMETEATFQFLSSLSPSFGVTQGYRQRGWARNGFNLRLLSNQFALTKERKQVQDEALEVNLNMNKDEFMDLLQTYFEEETVTTRRLIVMLFFCSDVLIRCYKINKDISLQYLQWSKDFFTESVSVWIFEHGGWSNVIQDPRNILARLIGLASLGIAFWKPVEITGKKDMLVILYENQKGLNLQKLYIHPRLTILLVLASRHSVKHLTLTAFPS